MYIHDHELYFINAHHCEGQWIWFNISAIVVRLCYIVAWYETELYSSCS